MKNRQYELVIRITSEDGEEKEDTIANPFETTNKKADKLQKKMDKFTKSAMKSVAINSSIAIVRGYTSTLGNSTINQQLDLLQQGISFATQTIVSTSIFGPIGLLMSLISTFPNMITKTIAYTQGSMWDKIALNKNVRRAGLDFNRSRF